MAESDPEDVSRIWVDDPRYPDPDANISWLMRIDSQSETFPTIKPRDLLLGIIGFITSCTLTSS